MIELHSILIKKLNLRHLRITDTNIKSWSKLSWLSPTYGGENLPELHLLCCPALDEIVQELDCPLAVYQLLLVEQLDDLILLLADTDHQESLHLLG